MFFNRHFSDGYSYDHSHIHSATSHGLLFPLVYDRDIRKRSLFVFLEPLFRNFDDRKQLLTFLSNFLRNCGQLFEKSRATCGKPQNITIANHSVNKSGPLFSEEGRMGVGQFEKYPCVAEKMRTRGTIKEEIEHVLSTIQVTFFMF